MTPSKSMLRRRQRIQEDRHSSYDPKSSPKNTRLDIYLRKRGYRLLGVSGDASSFEIHVKPAAATHLTPLIYKDDGEYCIHVSHYGALPVTDVQDLIKGYQTGIEIAQYLNGLTIDNVEVEEDY